MERFGNGDFLLSGKTLPVVPVLTGRVRFVIGYGGGRGKDLVVVDTGEGRLFGPSGAAALRSTSLADEDCSHAGGRGSSQKGPALCLDQP